MRAVVLVCVAACWRGQDKPSDPRGPKPPPRVVHVNANTLFERLGGLDAIEVIVDEWLKNIVGDVRLNVYFANADRARLRRLLIEQLCELSGGPCAYAGRSMRVAHTGMRIKLSEFDAMLDALVAALEHYKVPEQETHELVTELRAMQVDVVGI
jgi:hemoglobin